MADGKTRAAALAELGKRGLDASTKGLPAGTGRIALGEIGKRRWSLLSDLAMPAATLSRSAIEHNSRWMRAFIAKNGLSIAPHGKTTLAPQLFDLQERDGAWAITVSGVQQVELCRAFAFERILIANQVVGKGEIEYLFAELARSPQLELFCLVDSLEGVRRLAEGARGRPAASRLGLLLEIGFPGGRTGVRTFEAAMELARTIAAAGLTLRGIEAFEGLLKTPEEVDGLLERIADAAAACVKEGLFPGDGPVILSAGGTAYYDRVAARLGPKRIGRATQVITRSGCYLTHDSLLYDRTYHAIRARDGDLLPSGDPVPALMVWAHVQSRPEPARALVTMGRRDVGFDSGLPVPLLWYSPGRHARPVPLGEGYKVDGLNDQHGYLACPADSALAVGDIVGFGVSHPCTTFDKWQVVFVVDDDYRVVDAIKTFF